MKPMRTHLHAHSDVHTVQCSRATRGLGYRIYEVMWRKYPFLGGKYKKNVCPQITIQTINNAKKLSSQNKKKPKKNMTVIFIQWCIYLHVNNKCFCCSHEETNSSM